MTNNKREEREGGRAKTRATKIDEGRERKNHRGAPLAIEFCVVHTYPTDREAHASAQFVFYWATLVRAAVEAPTGRAGQKSFPFSHR